MKLENWADNLSKRIILDNGSYDIKFGTAEMDEPFPS